MGSRRQTQDVAGLLVRHCACGEAVEWAQTQTRYYSAWRTCTRGDWLLWIAARLDVDRRLVVIAACTCARLALRHVPTGEPRPLRAIETAEAWTRGEATLKEVRAAYAASAAAYATASAAYATDAAASAANAAADYAASAASAAAYADYAYVAAASAAVYAASAASAAAAYDAYDAAYAQCAREVRRVIPWRVVLERLGGKVK